MFKRIIVFDMDGTLVDSSHRYRTMPCGTKIDLQFWIENCTPEKIAQDSPIPGMLEFYRNCLADPHTYVVIATARVCESADMEFIRSVLDYPDMLVHRGSRDNTESGTKIKIRAVNQLRNLRQFAAVESVEIWEDNPAYMAGFCLYFKDKFPIVRGHFVPSNQGH